MSSGDLFTVLIADDDKDDRLLMSDAISESGLENPVEFVEDGVDLINYLNREGKYEHLKSEPLPGLILLDLNMPRMDGRTALKEIKSTPSLKDIPIIILTTSQLEEDISRTYGHGANSYIAKPVSFEQLIEITQTIKTYWTEMVALPAHTD